MIERLNEEIKACNEEGNMHIQLITNEPKAFDGFMAHYGKFSGVAHKSKALESVIEPSVPLPDWFQKGTEAALLAPTAMNQQKFTIERNGKQVFIKPGMGFYSKVDLGIVRYHFELGAGSDNFRWDTGFLTRFV